MSKHIQNHIRLFICRGSRDLNFIIWYLWPRIFQKECDFFPLVTCFSRLFTFKIVIMWMQSYFINNITCLMCACAKLQQINQCNNYVVHFFFMFGQIGYFRASLFREIVNTSFFFSNLIFFSLGVNSFPNLKIGFRVTHGT